jgi:hypothetical protein
MPQAENAPIRIEGSGDWRRLIERNLTTVIDPMVYRAGEIFLRGRSGRALGNTTAVPLEETRAWDFLDKNLLALGFFFDAVILNEHLPIFNYGDTFDMHLNFEQRSFAALNDADRPVIEPVDVTWGAYTPIKAEALAALQASLESRGAHGGPWLPAAEARSILDELSHVEFQWDISMGPELEALLPTEADRHLGRFLLGGMIFGKYADRMQSEHWLQPKRARLFVQATTGGSAPNREDEKELFGWLAETFNLPALNTWQPTFLHLVLERAKSLRDIPSIVNELRRSGGVRDYRAWRTQALKEWRNDGGLTPESLRTLDRLRAALTTRSGGLGAATDAGVAIVETVAKQSPESAAKAVVKAAPLFSWVLDKVPGRRHVKLLADSAHARGRYPHIERRVRTLWDDKR